MNNIYNLVMIGHVRIFTRYTVDTAALKYPLHAEQLAKCMIQNLEGAHVRCYNLHRTGINESSSGVRSVTAGATASH